MIAAAARFETQSNSYLGLLIAPPAQACTALVALVESGGRLPTDLLENALEAVARGLAAARQQLEAAAGQLAAARQGGWACALLAAADACMHSEAWHAAWHADAVGDAQAYKRTVELARDMLRQDLLPLLADASAQQGAATGFCLAPQYRALLTMGALLGAVAPPPGSWVLARVAGPADLLAAPYCWARFPARTFQLSPLAVSGTLHPAGRTAADIVGMRDPRHRRPGLRNFSVLNVLWNGEQGLPLFCEQKQVDLNASASLPSLLPSCLQASRSCGRACPRKCGQTWSGKVSDGWWTGGRETSKRACYLLSMLLPASSAAALVTSCTLYLTLTDLSAGLGGGEAAGVVLGFIRRDIRACHTLLDPGVGKLLQYWVQKARAVLGSYPGVAPACWSWALEVPLAAHQELALLAAAASGGSSSAAALGEALREQLLPRAVQLLVACLSSTTAEDKLRVSMQGEGMLARRFAWLARWAFAVHAVLSSSRPAHSRA